MESSKKSTKLTSSTIVFWIIGLIAICIIGFFFLGNHPKQELKPKGTIDYTGQPYLGNKSALVSIIEFGDYKCPKCKNFAENVIPIIQQQLVDTGKAKLYFLNDSFIYPDSIRAAKFAESVFQELGNETFWKFHDLLYKKQPEDSKYEKMDVYNENLLTNTLKEVATDEDVDKVVGSFHAKKSDSAWKRDMDLADKLGVTGTPTIFVDGKRFDGKTIDDLIIMVDKAAKAKE